MASTPEGKVKDKVKRLLARFCDENKSVTLFSGRLYAHWPVMNGMGSPTLDCIACYYGKYIAIETKVEGKALTPRQEQTKAQIEAAGGLVFVVKNDADIERLEQALNLIKWAHADNSEQ